MRMFGIVFAILFAMRMFYFSYSLFYENDLFLFLFCIFTLYRFYKVFIIKNKGEWGVCTQGK